MAADSGSAPLGYTHQPAYDSGLLRVSDIHRLHYEQYGKQDGLPVVFLHGGPGGHTSFGNTHFFNPAVYRVVLFDQRGAGRSLPRGELAENTTAHLVGDIETLRAHLGIARWHLVFGGSWGSTLALLYAQAHPERVGSVVLRGVFTATEEELAFSQGPGGAACLFPDAFEDFANFLPVEERGDAVAAYYRRLMSPDRAVALAAARHWNALELAMASLEARPADFAKLDDLHWSLTHAKFEAHYFAHRAWLAPGHILAEANMAKMRHLPGAIVHGRYDVVCPPVTAWKLHKQWPKAALHIVPRAGHSANVPEMAAKLIQVCDELATKSLVE